MKQCEKCGTLIEPTWSNYTARRYCLWCKQTITVNFKKYRPLDPLENDKLSVEEDRVFRAKSGEMRQRALQEYIELWRRYLDGKSHKAETAIRGKCCND